MKEKIKNEYAVKNGFDDWDDLLCNALPDFGRFAINEVMDIFVNQEVERRMAERMVNYAPVEAELQRAKAIHPDWPDDLYVQLAVMQEEAGEVAKAILDYSFHKGPADDIKKELIQTAAMCMRMLENFSSQKTEGGGE